MIGAQSPRSEVQGRYTRLWTLDFGPWTRTPAAPPEGGDLMSPIDGVRSEREPQCHATRQVAVRWVAVFCEAKHGCTTSIPPPVRRSVHVSGKQIVARR